MGGTLGFFLIALFSVGVSVVRSVLVFGLEVWFLFYNSLWRLFCTGWYAACESFPREIERRVRIAEGRPTSPPVKRGILHTSEGKPPRVVGPNFFRYLGPSKNVY